MAKKFLDYEGLDHYDSKIKAFIESGLNDTLQEALSTFSGALIPRGIIKNTGATSIDLRSNAVPYSKAKMGDTYFVGSDDLFLTYTNTAGTLIEDEEVSKGDAVICFVGAVVSGNGTVTTHAQWAILQANWSVTPNNNARLEFGASQATIKLAEIGGETIQLQVAPSSTIASSLRNDLADLGIVAVQKGTERPSKNIATSISSSSVGNLVPTDKAVYDFVSSHTPNAITKIDFVRDDTTGTITDPLTLDITGGENEGWLEIPVATTARGGVMSKTDKQNLEKSLTSISFRQTENKDLVLEYESVKGGTPESVSIPQATTTYPGLMSSTDKSKVDGAAQASTTINKTSSTNGVAVSLGGTIGSPTVSVSVNGGAITSGSSSIVSAGAVYSALTGTVYYNQITNAEIDALF